MQYNSTASTITCTFLNQLDTSIKICRVTYGECGRDQTQSIQESSSLAFPNTVTLMVIPDFGSFCYNVTANNSNFTVVVERNVQSKCSRLVPTLANLISTMVVLPIGTGPGESSSIIVPAVVGGVLAAGVISVIVFITIVLVIIRLSQRKKKGNFYNMVMLLRL